MLTTSSIDFGAWIRRNRRRSNRSSGAVSGPLDQAKEIGTKTGIGWEKSSQVVDLVGEPPRNRTANLRIKSRAQMNTNEHQPRLTDTKDSKKR